MTLDLAEPVLAEAGVVESSASESVAGVLASPILYLALLLLVAAANRAPMRTLDLAQAATAIFALLSLLRLLLLRRLLKSASRTSAAKETDITAWRRRNLRAQSEQLVGMLLAALLFGLALTLFIRPA